MLIFAPIGSVIALLFATFMFLKILKQPRGDEEMIAIQDAISEGVYAYIKRQYGVIIIFFSVVFCILFLLSKQGYLPIFVPFAFLTGGFFSGLSGHV